MSCDHLKSMDYWTQSKLFICWLTMMCTRKRYRIHSNCLMVFKLSWLTILRHHFIFQMSLTSDYAKWQPQFSWMDCPNIICLFRTMSYWQHFKSVHILYQWVLWLCFWYLVRRWKEETICAFIWYICIGTLQGTPEHCSTARSVIFEQVFDGICD